MPIVYLTAEGDNEPTGARTYYCVATEQQLADPEFKPDAIGIDVQYNCKYVLILATGAVYTAHSRSRHYFVLGLDYVLGTKITSTVARDIICDHIGYNI